MGAGSWTYCRGIAFTTPALAKASSGARVPVGATLMTDVVYDGVYSSLRRAIIYSSTFSENSLSLRAGTTLDVLENQHLGARATELGEELRTRLREELAPFKMVKEVGGLGMLSGIEFASPAKLTLKVAFEVFMRIRPAMFRQIVGMRMFRDKGILTQICGNNFMVLKVAPPLVISREQLEDFVAAIRDVVAVMHTSTSFWTEAVCVG
jgi:ornithine--oxo-acid transaminase